MHFSWKKKLYGFALGAAGYGLGSFFSIAFFLLTMEYIGPLVFLLSPAILGLTGGVVFGLMLGNRMKLWNFALWSTVVAVGSAMLLCASIMAFILGNTKFFLFNPLIPYSPLFLGVYFTSFGFLYHSGLDEKSAFAHSLQGLFAGLIAFGIALPYVFSDFAVFIVLWGTCTGGLMGFFLADVKSTPP